MAKDRSEDDELEEDAPRELRPRGEERLQSGAPPSKPPPLPEERPRHRDGDDRPRRRPPRDDNPLSTLIPYKNGLALGAYYTGVFSLIPCIGLVLGIVAVVLGFMGVNYAKRNPDAKGMGHAIAGIVLGFLAILGNIIGIVLLFVVMRQW